MAKGNWDDFTAKWGFNDGESTEGRDFRARDTLVELLKELPAVKAAGLTIEAFDREGMHNACLILVLDSKGSEADLPWDAFGEDFFIDDLISDAYWEADQHPDAEVE